MGVVRTAEVNQREKEALQFYDMVKEVILDAKFHTLSQDKQTHITEPVLREISTFIVHHNKKIRKKIIKALREAPYKPGDLPSNRRKK